MSTTAFDLEYVRGHDEFLDIGHDTFIQKIWSHEGGAWIGIIEYHTREGQEQMCGGTVPFNTPEYDWHKHGPARRATWTVVIHEPLTLTPSILCKECGHHGFIREGRWVPA